MTVPDRSRPTPLRRLLVGGIAVAALLGMGWALKDSLQSFDAKEELLPPPSFEESMATEPPPRFEGEPSDEERIRYYVSLLTSGDSEDAAWASAQLRAEGEPGRRAVLDIAQRSITSNPALLQHALVFATANPNVDAVPLATLALSATDPHAVQRAIRFFGALGGEPAVEAVPLIAEVARTRSSRIPFHALEFLGGLRHESARVALLGLAQSGPEAYRGVAWAQLAKHDTPETRAALRTAFDAEPDGDVKRFIAGALALLGDPHPAPWLLGVHMEKAPGDPDFEHAQRALSFLRDDRAFTVIESRLADQFDDGARLLAVTQLPPYEPERVIPVLRGLLEKGPGIDVRVHAWEQWIALGQDPGHRELLSLLGRAGRESSEDRLVALLVIGRLRDPAHVEPLLQALPRVVEGPEARTERGYILRALALIGAVEAIPTLVDAIVADTTPLDGSVMDSMAYQLWSVLQPAKDEVASALAAEVARALDEGGDTLTGAGLSHLLLLAGAHGDATMAPRVARHLSHADWRVREAAITALMTLGGPTARADLLAAWRRPQPSPTRALLRLALERVHFLRR